MHLAAYWQQRPPMISKLQMNQHLRCTAPSQVLCTRSGAMRACCPLCFQHRHLPGACLLWRWTHLMLGCLYHAWQCTWLSHAAHQHRCCLAQTWMYGRCALWCGPLTACAAATILEPHAAQCCLHSHVAAITWRMHCDGQSCFAACLN